MGTFFEARSRLQAAKKCENHGHVTFLDCRFLTDHFMIREIQ